MRTTPLERKSELTRSSPLARRPSRRRRASVSPAAPAQKAKIADMACIAGYGDDGPCVGPVDPMHLVDRSLAPTGGDDPLRVVPCCRRHHRLYDDHQLDITPYLEPRWRDEIAAAVQAVGLFPALRRLTGKRWQPVEDDS